MVAVVVAEVAEGVVVAGVTRAADWAVAAASSAVPCWGRNIRSSAGSF